MIYDDLEEELDAMCAELGIDLPEIDLSTVRLCLLCGEPLTGQSKKYHVACGIAVEHSRRKGYYKANRAKYFATEKKRKTEGPKCTCCGINPIGKTLHFLCNQCFEYDGDGWKEVYHRENGDKPRRRHPGDFDEHPSDEQMEYFKRGGR